MKPTAREYDFVVVLKNKNKKAVRLTGMLLCLLALFLFLYRSFRDAGSMMNMVAFFILLVLFSWSMFQLRKNEKVVFSPLLGIAGFGLIVLQPSNWLGIVYLAMAALERYAMLPQEIGFSADHIRFNGWPEKKYAWSDFTNIMLKDDILTMDFRNNKLFQKETDDSADPEYDGSEEEFNQFCMKNLDLSEKPAVGMENS
jgi:hypothetical protein